MTEKDSQFEKVIAPYAIVPGVRVTNDFGEVITTDFGNVLFHNGYMISIRYFNNYIVMTPRDYNGFVQMRLLKMMRGFNGVDGSVTVTDPSVANDILEYMDNLPCMRGVGAKRKPDRVYTFKDMKRCKEKIEEFLTSMEGKELFSRESKNDLRFKSYMIILRNYPNAISVKGRIMSIDRLNRFFKSWSIHYHIEKKIISDKTGQNLWVVVKD